MTASTIQQLLCFRLLLPSRTVRVGAFHGQQLLESLFGLSGARLRRSGRAQRQPGLELGSLLVEEQRLQRVDVVTAQPGLLVLRGVLANAQLALCARATFDSDNDRMDKNSKYQTFFVLPRLVVYA